MLIPPQGSNLPRHVAIIMDGNGRWAAERGLPRSAGHKQGVEALRGAVRTAVELGIEYLTIYSFSAENWSRPPTEVSFLLDLLRRFIRLDVTELHKAGVKIMVIGERDGLEPGIVSLLEEAERLTRENSTLKLIVAFNYGSRIFYSANARIGNLQNLHFPALTFGVAGIHSQDFGGKKCRFIAAGSGTNFENYVLFVVRIFW